MSAEDTTNDPLSPAAALRALGINVPSTFGSTKRHQGGTLQRDDLPGVVHTTAPPVGERWPVTRTGDHGILPQRWRADLYKRDGRRCRICGDLEGPFEMDHIVPWSAGGRTSLVNLRVLCRGCNQSRSNIRLARDAADLVANQAHHDQLVGSPPDDDADDVDDDVGLFVDVDPDQGLRAAWDIFTDPREDR